MPLKTIAINIVATLQKAGHIAYFAGGWVRDYLLDLPSSDIDIATSASVDEIQALFPKTIPIGIAFGIIVVVEKGHSFEVATFRAEKDHLDGRRPTHIESTTPENDALRRDFTINGIFYDPIENTLLDYVNGQEDIKKGVIRAIGDPHERFLEDRLRMIRAVRYSMRFQFPIEIDTEQAILSHAKSLFPSVAIERVWQELQKMSPSEHFIKGLISLYKLDLLPVIFPSLKNLSIDELEKRLAPISKLHSCPLIGKLLFLFPDPSLEDIIELCDYLKLSRQNKDLAKFLHLSKKLLLLSLELQASLEPVEWAYFYANTSSALALEVHSFKQTDLEKFQTFHKANKSKLIPFIQRIQTKNPLIRAEDLLKLGVKPGIEMGKLLKEAERISINDNIQDKESLISKLRNQIS
jgi:poly(A) polymerase